jgi:uncharacterized protein (TIGR02611 family)
MERWKRKWKRVPVAIRKPLILIVGSSIILTGLAMLILPGPGWAAIFLGFAVLATEFAFAEKVRAWLVKELFKYGRRLKKLWLDRFGKKPKHKN